MDPTVRPPSAPGFYRGDCALQMEEFLEGFVPAARPTRPVAGIVPHAGWGYSGRTAARVFRNLKERRAPDTVVVLGAVHRWWGRQPAVYPDGAWGTPLGAIAIDEPLAAALREAAGPHVIASREAHDGEHSIEVQLPMIRLLCPDARVLPVAVPPTKAALAFGTMLGQLVAAWTEGEVVIVGSTDLTHYGESYGFAPAGTGPRAEQWMRDNDDRILKRAAALDAAGVLAEAAENRNACGAGALAATIEAARALGVREGVLVDYATSHEVFPRGSFQMAVGYGGMLF